MNISEVSIRRPIFISMVILAIVVLGINAYTKLSIEMFPKVDIPWVTVMTIYPGANPEEIETQITDKLEDELSALSDLTSMKSESEENISIIALEFKVGVDLDAKAADVRAQVDAAKNILPDDAEDPMVLKLDLDSFPIMFFSVSSPRPPMQVRKTAEDVIKKKLETIPGVATVSLLGGKEREIHVDVDRNRLASKNINILQIVEALGYDNLNVPVGKLKKGSDENLVRVVGEYDSVEEIGEVEVNTQSGAIPLKDIATIRDGYKEINEYARLMGENAVNLSLQKQSGANTVQVSNMAIKEMEKLEERLPDYNVKLTSDLSRFIKDAVNDVKQNLLYGAIFATMMIMLFLRDPRSTFIVFLAIPTAIVSTFMPIYAAGFTINFMSLMGLAISVGTLVDNSTVVLENIFRHLEMGKSPMDAARDGVKEVGLAVIASGTTNICVFLPVAFMSGMTGQFFKEFGFTVAFATLFSIFVAFTLTPTLSARLLKGNVNGGGTSNGSKKQGCLFTLVALILTAIAGLVVFKFALPALGQVLSGAGGFTKFILVIAALAVAAGILVPAFKFGIFPAFDVFYGGIANAYPSILSFCLRRRFVIITLTILVFFSAIYIMASGRLGFEFVGEGDTGEFQVLVEMPPYASLEDTDAVVAKIETMVQKIPEFDIMSSTVGSRMSGSGTQSSDPTYGYLNVKLKPLKERSHSTNEILQDLRIEVAEIPDAIFQISQASMGGPPGQVDMEIEVSGPDMDELVALADKVEQIVKNAEGTIDVNSSWKIGKNEVQVKFNKKKMKELELNVGTVAATLRASIEGNTDIKYREEGDEYDIRVRFNPAQRQEIKDIKDIIILTNFGPVKLSSIAEIIQEQGPVGISRKNGIRMISIGCNLSGRSLGQVQTDITNTIHGKELSNFQKWMVKTFPKTKDKYKEIKGLDIKSDYEVKFAGQSEDMEEMFTQMIMAVLMAILFVYMVMAAQFESLFYPFVIMFSLPLTFIGVIWGLFLTGKTLNIMSMTGIVMLVGIVVNNSIILIDFVNQYRGKGMSRNEAIMAAGPARLRPILITSLSTIFGMLPAAVMAGSGGGFRQPMAIAAVGGMIVSSFLTLLVIPTVYTLVDDIVNFFGRTLRKLMFWAPKTEPASVPDTSKTPDGGDKESQD